MTSIKHYKAAIDFISQKDIDYRGIVIKLAQERPDILMHVVEVMRLNTPEVRAENQLQADVLMAWREGFKDTNGCYNQPGKIAAIKLHRVQTGSGLKEAKDYCDELQSRLNIQY